MKYIKFILMFSICITAIFGDYIVFRSKYSRSHIFRALADNSVHAIIGLFSSLLFFSHGMNVSNEACVYNAIFCTIVSSLIDIDHFMLARSIHLKDVTNLKQRGFLHCTTLWLAITTILFVYSIITKKLNINILNFMLIIAFTSHHIRDANRRGLWLFPFGHTPPLPRYMYILSVAILPNVLFYVFNYFKSSHKVNIVYSQIV